MGTFPADHGVLRILPDSRHPGDPGRLEQFPQHGQWTGSEAGPRAIPRGGKEELGMNDLDEERAAEQEAADAAVLRESRKHTRRSFAIAAVAAAAGWGFYEWIDDSPRLSMQPKPFRRAFQANARLSRTIFDDRALAPTYPLKRAEDLRVNGVYGLKQALLPESWRLQLTGVANARSYPQYVPDVTAWEYQYEDVKTHEDVGHDTKVAPGADTAEK